MPGNVPVKLPAGYAPAFAIGYSSADGALSLVNGAQPLPVTIIGEYAGGTGGTGFVALPAPLIGTATGTLTAGPFRPAAGVPVAITLAGTWTGEVQVLRSTDGGTIKLPLTAGGLPWGRYTANACEQVWSESSGEAELYLAITVASGSLKFGLAQ